MGNHITQLIRLGPKIHRDENGAQLGGSKVGFDKLIGVDLEHPDPITFYDPQFHQGIGQSVDSFVGLGKSPPLIIKNHKIPVRANGTGNV
jgi:hypothetical protein